MTAYETARLFVVIVAIYAVPAAICWYLIDRKLKQIEEKCVKYTEWVFDSCYRDITNINTRLRNIK